MTVTIPLEASKWPHFRVLTRDSWGASGSSGDSGSGWASVVMQRPQPNQSGMILLSYNRALLPQTGTAEIMFRYGRFLDRYVGASAPSIANLRAGETWDPTVDTLDIPDLIDKEIRIQAAPRTADEDPQDLDWVTVFWGTCEYQTERSWGGASMPAGERHYHLVDALFRLKRWPMDRHGFYLNGTAQNNAMGHPGYNSQDANSQIEGNKESTGVTFTTQSGGTAFSHTRSGAGTTWTDTQSINNALAVSRPKGEPLWTLSGATDLFNGTSSLEVREQDTAFDFLTRACNRGRGKGAVALSWTESSPDGSLSPLLVAYAQLADDLDYTAPVAGAVTINGATSNGTTVEVDLIGDHRVVQDGIELGDAQQYQVDYLETLGEKIQSLVTVSYYDETLEIGWKASEATSFAAITDPTKRCDLKYLPIYQLHRLSRSFSLNVKNGNGGAPGRCDFTCDDAGQIVLGAYNDTSILTCKVMDDLPLYLGYVYTTTPARSDGQTTIAYAGTPMRMQPLVFVRNSSANYIPVEKMSQPVSIKVGPDAFVIEASNNQHTGLRYFGDTTVSTLQSVYTYDKIGMTIALELPHHVRFASGDPFGKRRKRIIHGGLHLWVAHQGAIWGFDTTNNTNGAYPAFRAAASGTSVFPGILRDDRDALARLHYLSVAWYGPLVDLIGETQATRRSAQWSLRCCGDIPSSEDYDGGGVIYPNIGKVVTVLSANGQRITLNTPVSSVSYDNTNGVTTWVTDWQDLDFA